jgi:hypothetical protein
MAPFIPERDDERDRPLGPRPSPFANIFRYRPREYMSDRLFGLRRDDRPRFFDPYLDGPTPYDDFYDDEDYDYDDDDGHPDFEMRKKRMHMKRKRHVIKRKVKRS